MTATRLPLAQITTAGAFEYYIEYDDTKTGKRIRCKSGYFSVDPILSIPARTSILDDKLAVLPVGKGGVVTDKEVNLPLDGLVIQSVIAKWMGPLAEWGPNLDLMSERGYNMIHFTPLQPRGASGSPYSIYDQLKFDPFLFGKGDKDQIKTLKKWLDRIKKEWGILGLIDVVLNHTASDSYWLEDHPEAGKHTRGRSAQATRTTRTDSFRCRIQRCQLSPPRGRPRARHGPR